MNSTWAVLYSGMAKQKPHIILRLMRLFALLILLLAGYAGWQVYTLTENTRATNGLVLDMALVDSESGTRYLPLISYRDGAGQFYLGRIAGVEQPAVFAKFRSGGGVVLSSRIESVAEDNGYIPLVEYTTLAGQTLRGEPSGVQFTNERAPGSRLILRYAREEPRLFRLENRLALWGSAGFLAFIGLVFLAVLWLLRPKRI